MTRPSDDPGTEPTAPADGGARSPVVELAGVEVHRGRDRLVGPVDWRVGPGEPWPVVGPNGSGKTTLLQVASACRQAWPNQVKLVSRSSPMRHLRRHP